MKVLCKYDAMVNVEDLKPHPLNRNKHPKDQIERLSKILSYQGIRAPIVVSTRSDFIAKGHGTLLAIQKNGWSEAPVVYQDFDSDEQEYAFVQSDNAIASWSELDLAGINSDVGDLGPDFDIDLLGIKDFVIEPAEKLAPQCGEDEVPEHVEPRTRLGDIIQLGVHRLMCGDSTSIDAVEKLMNGDKADITFTSPPYNADSHLDYGKGRNKKLYDNDLDNKSSDDYVQFCHDVLKNIFLVTNGFIFWNVNYNAKSRFEYVKGIFPFVDYLWETIVWKKTGMPIPSGLTRNCEFIYCFKNTEHRKHISKDFETEFNHWDISNIGSQHKDHRAAFPVALPQKAIEISTDQSHLVLDLFGGSGSTLIACEKTNRKCFMMEIDPHYCDVIVARWEKYIGKKAELVNEQG